ncbi:MAG: hypothetical protein D6694_15270 [Gammaproteobacteria bacterium]|nr:MAG: hypothetical protein D6694_15270 [Gammaproteobacteria bacterium]
MIKYEVKLKKELLSNLLTNTDGLAGMIEDVLNQIQETQVMPREPQLHIHVIAQRHTDAAWPDPAWGHGATGPCNDFQHHTCTQALQHAIGGIRFC